MQASRQVCQMMNTAVGHRSGPFANVLILKQFNVVMALVQIYERVSVCSQTIANTSGSNGLRNKLAYAGIS